MQIHLPSSTSLYMWQSISVIIKSIKSKLSFNIYRNKNSTLAHSNDVIANRVSDSSAILGHSATTDLLPITGHNCNPKLLAESAQRYCQLLSKYCSCCGSEMSLYEVYSAISLPQWLHYSSLAFGVLVREYGYTMFDF